MRPRPSLHDIRKEAGAPAALLKIVVVTMLFPLFGFQAMKKDLWMDNWFWTPLTYACVITALVSIVTLLALMLIKSAKDLRKLREHS